VREGRIAVRLAIDFLLDVKMMTDEPRRINRSHEVTPRLPSDSFVALISVFLFLRGCELLCARNLEGARSGSAVMRVRWHLGII
jgi:hypothetical protein